MALTGTTPGNESAGGDGGAAAARSNAEARGAAPDGGAGKDAPAAGPLPGVGTMGGALSGGKVGATGGWNQGSESDGAGGIWGASRVEDTRSLAVRFSALRRARMVPRTRLYRAWPSRKRTSALVGWTLTST